MPGQNHKESTINRLTRTSSLTSLFSNKSKASQRSANGKSKSSHEKADSPSGKGREMELSRKRKRNSLLGFMRNEHNDSGEDDADEDEYAISKELGTDEEDSRSDEDIHESDGGRLVSRRLSNQHVSKKRRQRGTQTAEELAAEEALVAFEKREQELDAELDPQYRKFRPRGFKFNVPPQDRPVRVYADGVFDLFHLGHMRQLEQAKKALPNVTLICGIPSDEETHRRKGLTVLSDSQRADTLVHCKWVDEVISDAPWCVTPEFLELHKIDYVAHDDLPYASGNDDDIYRPIKEAGKFLTTQRTEGISTSDIITKIIRDYDKYLMRNFARGASRQELNVSWFKKNELDLKRHVMEFRESFKTNFETASKDLYSEIRAYISNTLGNNSGSSGGSTVGSSNGTPTKRRNSISSNKSGKSLKSSKSISSISSSNRSRRGSSSSNKKRSTSPATDFAANFSGGEDSSGRGRKRPTSFIGNVKGWMSRKPSVPASPVQE